MSNKYELTETGVLDLETGASIPNAEGNRHWRKYQEWLAEGNTPRPIRPPFCEWDGEMWVEDTPAKERAEALSLLAQTDKEQARTVDDIMAYLLNNTPIPQVAIDRQAARAEARGKL